MTDETEDGPNKYLAELDALDTSSTKDKKQDAPAAAPEAEASLSPTVGASLTSKSLEEQNFYDDVRRFAEEDAARKAREKTVAKDANFFSSISGPMQNWMRRSSEGMDAVGQGLAEKGRDYPAGEFTKGMTRNLVGGMGLAGGGVQTFGEQLERLQGQPGTVSDLMQQSGSALSQRMEAARQREPVRGRVERMSQITKENWFKDTVDYIVGSMGEAAGSGITLLGAGAMGGPMLAVPTLYSMSTGEVRQEMEQAGVNPKEHGDLLMAAGALHASLEYIPGYQSMMNALTSDMKKEVDKAIFKSVVKGFVSGGSKEAVTEGLQTVVEKTAAAYAKTGDPAAVQQAIINDLAKGFESEILESAVKGGIGGAPMEAGGKIIEARNSHTAPKATNPNIITPTAPAAPASPAAPQAGPQAGPGVASPFGDLTPAAPPAMGPAPEAAAPAAPPVPVLTPEEIADKTAKTIESIKSGKGIPPEFFDLAQKFAEAQRARQPQAEQAPAAAPLSAAVEPFQLGQEGDIVTPDGGMSVKGTPELVELDDLKHAEDDLQPRDRSRAESEVGVRERAAGLDPARLMPHRVSDQGAPIVASDGTIVSGNGRVMSLREAYKDPVLRARAEAYRASLGEKAAAMRQPVLIQRLPQMPREDLARFADLSNRSAIAAMSATERAQRDARAGGQAVMGLYRGGSFLAPENRDFLRAFLNHIVTPSERGSLSRDGILTKEGEDRMSAAVLAAAYGNSDMLGRMLESTDDNIRGITHALRDAAGAFMRLKEAIRNGEADAKFDITPQIGEAARLISELREKRIKPADFLAQQDAFTAMDPIVEGLVRAFYNDEFSRQLGREKLTELLNLYADEAAKHRAEGLIPDETSVDDVIKYARERAVRSPDADQGGLFADGTGDAGRVDGSAGQEALGRADDGRGPAAAGEGQAREPAGAVDTGTAAGREGTERRVAARAVAEPAEAQAHPDLSKAEAEALKSRFYELIASQAPRDTWGALMGLDEAGMAPLVAEAVREGYLRIDRRGQPARTTKSRFAAVANEPMAPADGSLTVSPEVRLDRAVALLAERGRTVSPEVRKVADAIEAAVGTANFGAAFAQAQALSRDDLVTLAALSGGLKIKTSTTKQQALAALAQRNEALMAYRRNQAIASGLPAIGRVAALDMSPEARKERAQAMGFDTSKVWYHRTDKEFDAFRPSQGRFAFGVYFSKEPVGPAYGNRLIEAYVRGQGTTEVRLEKLVAEYVKNGEARDDAIAKAYRDLEQQGYGYIDLGNEIAVWNPANIRSVEAAFDPAADGSPLLLASIRNQISAAEQGQAQARELDNIGFFSAALEAAKGLKQEKGTGQQMLAQLRKGGAKEAEIKATGLEAFLDGKKGVTRDEIVEFLRQNRVQVRENTYAGQEVEVRLNEIDERYNEEENTTEYDVEDDATGDIYTITVDDDAGNVYVQRHDGQFIPVPGRMNNQNYSDGYAAVEGYIFNQRSRKGVEGPAQYEQYSIDEGNPTYTESVIYLPSAVETSPRILELNKEIADLLNEQGDLVRTTHTGLPPEKAEARDRRLKEIDQRYIQALNERNDLESALRRRDFQSGHWEEPNIVAHARTSIQKDGDGRNVFLIDELQSDWGQKIREGGELDEGKIADIEKRLEQARADQDEFMMGEPLAWVRQNVPGYPAQTNAGEVLMYLHRISQGGGLLVPERMVSREMMEQARAFLDDKRSSRDDIELLIAERNTAMAATPGNPMVATTDQWVGTALRRLLTQAVNANADAIAFSPGELQLHRYPYLVTQLGQIAAEHIGNTILVRIFNNLGNTIGSVNVDPSNGQITATSGGFWKAYDGKPFSDILGADFAAKALAAKSGETSVFDAHGTSVGGKGMLATYDGIYLRAMSKMLAKLDLAAGKLDDRQLLSHDGRSIDYPFHTFPLTEKIKAAVRQEGLALFSIRQAVSPSPELSATEKQIAEARLAALLEEDIADAIGQGSDQADGRQLAQLGSGRDHHPGQPLHGESRGAGRGKQGAGQGASGRSRNAAGPREINELLRHALNDAYLREVYDPAAVEKRANEQRFRTVAYHGTLHDFDVPDAFRLGRDFGFHVALKSPAAANERLEFPGHGKHFSTESHWQRVLRNLGLLPKHRLPKRSDVRIMPLRIRVENPLRMPDMPSWNSPFHWQQALRSKTSGIAAEARGPLLEYVDAWVKEHQGKKRTPHDLQGFSLGIAEKLDELGYDAIVYRNRFEDKGSDSMLLWKPSNIRSANDAFDHRADGRPEIRASLPFVEADRRAKINELATKIGLPALYSMRGDAKLRFGKTLGTHADIKTNFPDADFWIVRKGSDRVVGTPTREYSPEHIGVRIRNHLILPDYLYYAMQYMHQRGFFQERAHGTLNLKSIKVSDVAEVPIEGPSFPSVLPSIAYTQRFENARQSVAKSILEGVQRMLPPSIAVAVEDRIVRGGLELNGMYEPVKRLLSISLAGGADNAVRIGRHEVVHALRELGLFTDAEWKLLVERAKKIGIDDKITMSDLDGSKVSAIPEYMRLFEEYARGVEGLWGDALAARVDELMNQERVANMAEAWEGGARYGSTMDALFQRLKNFLEAVRNALHGYGFRTADDVFRAMVNGEIGARARIEPSLDVAEAAQVAGEVFQPEPMTADRLVASPAGQAMLAAVDDFDGVPTEGDQDAQPFALPGHAGTITTQWTDDGSQVRTYQVSSEDGARKAAVVLSQTEDGAWEASGYHLAPDADRTLLAQILDMAATEIGQPLSPTGLLSPNQVMLIAQMNPAGLVGLLPVGEDAPSVLIAPKASAMLASIAGVKSRTAPRSSLNLAESLERKGRDAEYILKNTGWFRGSDGKWRYEIDDSKAKLINLDKVLQSGKGSLFGRMLGKRAPGVPSWAGKDIKLGRNIMLPDVLDHPALFNAYPVLRQMRTSIIVGKGVPRDRQGGTLVFREADGKLIYNPIQVRVETEAGILPTLMHEIQHYIQNKEGFAGGSSTSLRTGDFKVKPLDYSKDGRQPIVAKGESFSPGTAEATRDALGFNEFPNWRSQIAGLSRAERLALDIASVWDALDSARNGNVLLSPEVYNYMDIKPALRPENGRRRIVDVKYVKETLLPYMQAELMSALRVTTQDYLASAGEQEANTVMDRLHLTAEQRRNLLPPTRNTAAAMVTPDFGKAADAVLDSARRTLAIREKWQAAPIDLGDGIAVTRINENELMFDSEANTGWRAEMMAALDWQNGRAVLRFSKEAVEGEANPQAPKALDDASMKLIADKAEAYVRSLNLLPTADPRMAPIGGVMSQPLSDKETAFWRSRDPYFMPDTNPDLAVFEMPMPADYAAAQLDEEQWRIRDRDLHRMLSDEEIMGVLKGEIAKVDANIEDLRHLEDLAGDRFHKVKHPNDQAAQRAWTRMLQEHDDLRKRLDREFREKDSLRAEITRVVFREKLAQFKSAREDGRQADRDLSQAIYDLADNDNFVRALAKKYKADIDKYHSSGGETTEEAVRASLRNGEDSGMLEFGEGFVELARKYSPEYARAEARQKQAYDTAKRLSDEVKEAGGLSPYLVDGNRYRKRPKVDYSAAKNQGLPSVRRTLSIPGLKEKVEAKTAAQLANERAKQKLRGPFAARPNLEWLGIPGAEFVADVDWIAEKRSSKDGEGNQYLETPEAVRAHIEDVLTNAEYAYRYQTEPGKPERYTLVVPGKDGDKVVSVEMKAQNGRLRIPTAFIAPHRTTAARIVASVEENGADSLKYKEDRASREALLRHIAQAPAESHGPQTHVIRRVLRSGQGAVLASIRKGAVQSGQQQASAQQQAQHGDAPRKLDDIIEDLKKALGMPVTQGIPTLRVKDRKNGRSWFFRPKRGVLGQYESPNGIARIKTASDIETIAHEGGHHLERLFGQRLENLLQAHATELAGYGTSMRNAANALSEGFAEWFATYVTNPTKAEQDAPNFTKAFENLLDSASPEILEQLDKVQVVVLSKAYQEFLQSDEINQMLALLASNAPKGYLRRMADGIRYVVDQASVIGYRKALQQAFLEEIGQDGTISGMASQIYAAGIDENHPHYQLVRRLLDLADRNKMRDAQGRAISLAVHENPYKLMRSVGDAFKTGLRWIQDGMPNYRHSDAGYAVEAPNGQVLKMTSNMAEAQAAQLASPGSTIREMKGHRSASLHDAISKAMGGTAWNQKLLDLFNGYLVSRRAIEEWKTYEAKQAQLKALAAAIEPLQKQIRSDRAKLNFHTNGDMVLVRQNIKAMEATLEPLQKQFKDLAENGIQRAPHRKPRDAHERFVARVEASNPAFRYAAQMVYDFLWWSALHDFQAGRLSQAELDYRATRKHFYVPFARSIPDLESAGLVATGRAAGGRRAKFKKDKAFTGSSRSVYNPIETIIDQAFHRAAATHLNDAIKAYVALAERVGPGSAALGERVVQQDLIAANDAGFRALEQQLMAMGYTAQDAKDQVKRIEADFGDTSLLLQYDSTVAGPAKPLNVTFWENGERKYFRINDPETAKAIHDSVNGVGRELSNLFVDMLSKPATALRMGVTTNPAFILRNIIRDAMSAWVLTGSLVNPATWPVVTQARGLYHEIFQTEMARMYQEVAGLMGGQNVAALPHVKDKMAIMELEEKGLHINIAKMGVLGLLGGGVGFATMGPAGAAFGAMLGVGLHKGPKKFFQTIAHFSDMSETATRLGVFTEAYKAALRYNPSLTAFQATQEAAFVARDLIDFGRRGSIMLSAARVTPFLNANLQGLDKAQRALLGRSDRGNTISVPKLLIMMGTGATVGALASGAAVGAAATFAVPATAIALASRVNAARALITPMFKADYGLEMSADEQRALGASARVWVNLMLLTLAGVALVATSGGGGDDDEYRMIRDKVKYKGMPVKIPFSDKWTLIPKPFEWAVPMNVIEAGIEAQFHNDPRFWEQVREGLDDVLTPPVVPQVARMWSDIRGNYDSLTQRPITPDFLKSLPPEERFNAYASQGAIALSRYVNSRPDLKAVVDATGSKMFGNKFELTPAVIDYALRQGLGYWGKDAQRASNVALTKGRGEELRSEKLTELPLIGTMVGGFMLDPYRAADATDAFYDAVGRDAGTYAQAATGYAEKLKRYGAQTANQYLATLPEDQRAYALLQASASKAEQERVHPLNRLKNVVKSTGDLEREIIMGRLVDTSSPSDLKRITLAPALGDQVRDVLAKIKTIEINNTMVALGYKQFASRGMLDVKPSIEVLRASAPQVADELERRESRAHVRPFEDVVEAWKGKKGQLLNKWQEAQSSGEAISRPQSSRNRRNFSLPYEDVPKPRDAVLQNQTP